jgi:hypothetical protein
MKKIIIFITLITSLLSLFAQEDRYAPVLSQIEQNSTTLKALRYRSQWQQLYAQAAQLRETVERYAAVFSQHNNADLLYKAYISGEMPLLNYLLETEYYLSAYEKQLQAQRDLELTLSELNGFRL